MKDKQGECPSLFMPTGRRGNVTQAQQPLSVGSSHIGKEQPGHTAHPPLCLLLDTFWVFLGFFVYSNNVQQWQGKHLHFQDYLILLLLQFQF